VTFAPVVRRSSDNSHSFAGLERDPLEAVLGLSGEWHTARRAVELLWRNDFDRLKDILGDHATLAMAPEAAMHPCHSVCERGWVPYKFAGELPAEPSVVETEVAETLNSSEFPRLRRRIA
jgi:hypothetical protein